MALERRKIRVLVTGFGPFPGVPRNISSDLVTALATSSADDWPSAARRSRMDIMVDWLPVAWGDAETKVQALYKLGTPDIALHFGVSEKARGFEIERCAVNQICGSEDADGLLPDVSMLNQEAPQRLWSNLPIHNVLKDLRAAGVRANASNDAGTYLCNATLFHALNHTKTQMRRPMAGFVHIPVDVTPTRRLPPARVPVPSNRPVIRGLNWDMLVRGAQLIVDTCVQHRLNRQR